MAVNVGMACARAGAILLGTMALCAAPVFGQGTRQMVQVAKDVYTMTGAGSNASFVVTDEGVLAFDGDIRNNDVPAIRKVTNQIGRASCRERV